MKFTYPVELHDFVEATELCNCDSPEIIAKADEITRNSKNPEDAACQVFKFVRDKFLFSLTNATEKASETLKGNEGWCITKTNLQIALLRSLGIPARYHQVVLHKRAMKGIISELLYKQLKERIWFHPWCECFLSGKWIICDLYLDKYTYLAAIQEGIITKRMIPSIDWDGVHDLRLVTPYMIEDVGLLSSYDEVCKLVAAEMKLRSFLPKLIVRQSNRHTSKLRANFS